MRITGPGESPLLLIKVINIADRLGIRYAVIGAMAVSFYGIVRSSMDADAVISLGTNDNLDRLVEALRDTGFKAEARKGTSDDPIRGIVHVTDKFDNRVDLLTGIKGMSDEVFSRLVKTSLLDHSLKMIGVEDLIAMKIFAGNPKDLDDVSGILSISAKRINVPLLKQLTKRYGTKEAKLLEKFLTEYNLNS
jgi:predicted nucleotidyltransferase